MKKCVSCNSKSFSEIYDLGNHKIAKCSKCSLVRTLGKVEESYDEYHRDEDYTKYDKYFRNIFKKRYCEIAKYKPKPGKVLDIGASSGTMLSIFKENSWEVWGVEPSRVGNVAMKRGIKIIKSNFEDAKLPREYFDVVIINHTLEHVEDPLKVLNKIHKILSKNGLVYIDVPNFASLDSKIYKSKWRYLLPREHTFHFTPESLSKLITKANFKIMRSSTASGYFDVASPILKIWHQVSSLEKHFYKNLIFDLINFPKDVLSKIINNGSSLHVLAMKK